MLSWQHKLTNKLLIKKLIVCLQIAFRAEQPHATAVSFGETSIQTSDRKHKVHMAKTHRRQQESP